MFQVDEDSEKNLFQIIEFGFSKYFDSTNKLMLQNFINCLDRKNNPSVRYAIVVKVWAPKVARVANLEGKV